MSLLWSIRRIRSSREKKSASHNRRLRENLKSDRPKAFGVQQICSVELGWGTFRGPDADVRVCGWSALFTRFSARPRRLQRNTAELETGATRRSDAARQMVGDLSGSAAQR